MVELQARRSWQSTSRPSWQAIEADKRDFLFAEVLKCCQTRALMQKERAEPGSESVTKDLQAALERELKSLGRTSSSLSTSPARGVRGCSSFGSCRLLLCLKPSSLGILSEGEQRAIAIASFLAEVSLEPSKSGIVFDDPVNSLDHVRRERIANRLALEAKSRQVIVFTHDLAFAWELSQQAQAQEHQAAVRHVYAACAQQGPMQGHAAL